MKYKHPEYKIWKAMKARCYAKSNKNVGKYQKNNIQVCQEWINDFDKFYEDMGKRPSKKHSLDRIDNLKNYSKENCRWVTHDIQTKNRGSFNKIFTHNGESLVLKEWSKVLNIKYTTLYTRIFRNGLSFDQAIKNDPYNKLIEINNEKKTLKEWCMKYNRKYSTVVNRIHDGWDKVKAILTETKNQ